MLEYLNYTPKVGMLVKCINVESRRELKLHKIYRIQRYSSLSPSFLGVEGINNGNIYLLARRFVPITGEDAPPSPTIPEMVMLGGVRL